MRRWLHCCVQVEPCKHAGTRPLWSLWTASIATQPGRHAAPAVERNLWLPASCVHCALLPDSLLHKPATNSIIRTFLNDFYEYILSFSSKTRFSINSPQTSAARDSVLVSPDSQIGQNQLPVSLKPHTADKVQRWGAFRSQKHKGTTGFV